MTVSSLTNLSGVNSIEIIYIYDRTRSYILAKAIVGSITKISINKLRLHRRVYEWTDDGGIISNHGPTMLYLVLKSINPDTSIGVSNIKYEIDKENLSKFGNNVKELLDNMYSN